MQRIQSLDLARGLTVLFMPSIHVVMLYSQPQVQQSILGDILAFIAEGPGAQLFMLLMGVSFTFSSRINPQYVLQRAIILLLAAYALNILKFIVPLHFGWMPKDLMVGLQLNDSTASPFFFLLGDILHFAAIAYVVLFLIYRIKHYATFAFLLAIAIMLLSPLFWDVKTEFVFVNYLLQLLGGHPPQVFFPVFPWLVYPLMGLALGYFLKEYDATRVLQKAGILGIIMMLFSCLFPYTQSPKEWLAFYRTKFPDTLFHLGLVLTWLFIFHWFSRKIAFNPLFELLIFCSKHITSIYLVQWLLIFWCIPIAGYQTLGFYPSFCWMANITVLTFLLAILFKQLYANQKHF